MANDDKDVPVLSFDDMVKQSHRDQKLRQLYEEIVYYSNAERKKRSKLVAPSTFMIDYQDDLVHNGLSNISHKKRRLALHLIGVVLGPPTNKQLHALAGVPKDWELGELKPTKHDYCCGASSVSRPTKCLCRFIAFRKHTFLELLIIIEQILCVRAAISKMQTDSVRAKEVFNGVFGVSNISSYGGSNGTRGLFYYFHSMKCLGTFCSNAMSVLLGEDNWTVMSETVVCDAFRLRSHGKVEELREVFETKAVHNEWIIGRATCDAYSKIDILVGYALYLSHDNNDRKDPSRTQLVKEVVEAGMHQQPNAPNEVTGRRETASADVKIFIKQYDSSLCISRKTMVASYFKVANPAGHYEGKVFLCKG